MNIVIFKNLSGSVRQHFKTRPIFGEYIFRGYIPGEIHKTFHLTLQNTEKASSLPYVFDAKPTVPRNVVWP